MNELGRRGFLGLAAGTVAAAGLAACGTGGKSKGGSAKGKPVTLWTPYAEDARQKQLKVATDKFTAETGIKVVTETVPFANFNQKWPAAQAGRALPDVAINTAENALGMYTAQALLPLDDVVKSLGGDSAFIGDLVNNVGRFDGKVITLPHYIHDRLLFYRTDRLAKAGLSVPVSWDDALAAAEAMSAPPKYNGWIMQLSQKDTGGGYLLWIFARSNGGHLFDADGKVTLDSPEVMEAIEFMQKLGRKAVPQISASTPIADTFDLFNSGKSSIEVTSAAGVNSAANNAPDVAATMAVTRMPKKTQFADLLGAVSFVAPKGNNPEGGQELIKFLYRKDNYLPFLQGLPLFMFPALTSASGPEFYSEPMLTKYKDAVDVTLEGLKNAQNPGFDFGPTPLAAPFFSSHAVEKLLQDVMFGGVSIDKAVAEATKTAQAAIDDVKSHTGG